MKIFAGRASILGDTVMALPMLNCLHKMYDSPEIHWAVAPKCKQAAPLYLFQDKIDKIILTHDSEGILKHEQELLDENYDLVLNVFPPHPREQDWYNYRSCTDETMLMASEHIYNVWQKLPEDQKRPRLNNWWNKYDLNHLTTYKKDEKCHYIALHTTAGYGSGNQRSPNIKWWRELVDLIYERFPNTSVIQLGHPKDEEINVWTSNLYQAKRIVQDIRKLSLFEQIQIATECDCYIGTDSGFSWIMGALGVKQISLLTNWLPNHYTNPMALAAVNSASNGTNLFAEGGCDNIKINDVLKLL